MKIYLAMRRSKRYAFKDLSEALKKVKQISGYLRIVNGGYVNDYNCQNESRKPISSR